MKQTKQPIAKFRCAASLAVRCNVWEHEGNLSVSIVKSFKDKDGQWKDTNTFFPADLLALKVCVDRAVDFIDQAKEQARQTKSAPVPEPFAKAFPGSTSTVSVDELEIVDADAKTPF